MGNPISKVREEAKKADEQQKEIMKEHLQQLEALVKERLGVAYTKILQGNKGDEEIHSGTVVSLHQQINITQKSKESQQLKDAIGDFFSGDFMGGLEKIVQVGAETILGNDSMGQCETSDMFIVFSENALLRCDAYYYRWNFSAKGVIDIYEGALGVLLVKRVVDVTKTDPQVVTWAISELATRQGLKSGDASKLIDDAMATLSKVVEFQMKVKQVEAGPTPAK